MKCKYLNYKCLHYKLIKIKNLFSCVLLASDSPSNTREKSGCQNSGLVSKKLRKGIERGKHVRRSKIIVQQIIRILGI